MLGLQVMRQKVITPFLTNEKHHDLDICTCKIGVINFYMHFDLSRQSLTRFTFATVLCTPPLIPNVLVAPTTAFALPHHCEARQMLL